MNSNKLVRYTWYSSSTSPEEGLLMYFCEACRHAEGAANAHAAEVAAMRAQLQAVQEATSKAQAELRADRAKLEALEGEAALLRQGVAELEAALQQERLQHEESTCKVILITPSQNSPISLLHSIHGPPLGILSLSPQVQYNAATEGVHACVMIIVPM